MECEYTLVDKEGTIQIQMLANSTPKIMGYQFALDFLFFFSFNELIIELLFKLEIMLYAYHTLLIQNPITSIHILFFIFFHYLMA